MDRDDRNKSMIEWKSNVEDKIRKLEVRAKPSSDLDSWCSAFQLFIVAHVHLSSTILISTLPTLSHSTRRRPVINLFNFVSFLKKNFLGHRICKCEFSFMTHIRWRNIAWNIAMICWHSLSLWDDIENGNGRALFRCYIPLYRTAIKKCRYDSVLLKW